MAEDGGGNSESLGRGAFGISRSDDPVSDSISILKFVNRYIADAPVEVAAAVKLHVEQFISEIDFPLGGVSFASNSSPNAYMLLEIHSLKKKISDLYDLLDRERKNSSDIYKSKEWSDKSFSELKDAQLVTNTAYAISLRSSNWLHAMVVSHINASADYDCAAEISSLGIKQRNIISSNFKTLRDLAKATRITLLGVDGIGPVAVEKIGCELESRGLMSLCDVPVEIYKFGDSGDLLKPARGFAEGVRRYLPDVICAGESFIDFKDDHYSGHFRINKLSEIEDVIFNYPAREDEIVEKVSKVKSNSAIDSLLDFLNTDAESKSHQ